MAVPYHTLDDAIARMNDSILLFNGEPVYVSGIRGVGRHVYVTYYPLPLGYSEPNPGRGSVFLLNKDPKTAMLHDPGWSSRGFHLGYVNTQIKRGVIKARWIQRYPVRGGGYKAGLTVNNLDGIDGIFNFPRLVSSENFRDALMNVYPTRVAAFEKVFKVPLKDGEEMPSWAFGRTFAFQNTDLGVMALWHKGMRVATTTDNKRFRIIPGFEWVKETLLEEGLTLE